MVGLQPFVMCSIWRIFGVAVGKVPKNEHQHRLQRRCIESVTVIVIVCHRRCRLFTVTLAVISVKVLLSLSSSTLTLANSPIINLGCRKTQLSSKIAGIAGKGTEPKAQNGKELDKMHSNWMKRNGTSPQQPWLWLPCCFRSNSFHSGLWYPIVCQDHWNCAEGQTLNQANLVQGNDSNDTDSKNGGKGGQWWRCRRQHRPPWQLRKFSRLSSSSSNSRSSPSSGISSGTWPWNCTLTWKWTWTRSWSWTYHHLQRHGVADPRRRQRRRQKAMMVMIMGSQNRPDYQFICLNGYSLKLFPSQTMDTKFEMPVGTCCILSHVLFWNLWYKSSHLTSTILMYAQGAVIRNLNSSQ